MNPPFDTTAQSISTAAIRCREVFRNTLNVVQHDFRIKERLPHLFRQAAASRPIYTINDLRDELEQFHLWAENIGVFAADHDSIDYRLREALDVKDSVTTLLDDLSSSLTQLNFLLAHDRPLESGTSDRSDSDDSDDEAYDGETPSDPIASSARELQHHLSHVSSVINKLCGLARVIRASGARSRAARAARFEYFDGGINHTQVFEQQYLPQVLRVRFGLKDPLLARLCNAIALRRRYFMYQAAHQARLAYGTRVDNVYDTDFHKIPQTSTNADAVVANPMINAQMDLRLPTPRAAMTASTRLTQATTFRGPLKRAAPSTLFTSTTRVLSGEVDLPPPPRSSHGKDFQCPYCRLLLSGKKAETVAWRKHVIADLQPFVCVAEDCLDPHVILETGSDWIEHHKWTHALQWWCEGDDIQHGPIPFQSAEEYRAHLFNEHMATLSIQCAGTPSQEPFQCCPFCQDYPPEQNITTWDPGNADGLLVIRTRQRALKSHISDHLMEMFILALPERCDFEDINSGDSESHASGSGAARGSNADFHERTEETFMDIDLGYAPQMQEQESQSVSRAAYDTYNPSHTLNDILCGTESADKLQSAKQFADTQAH